MMKFSFTIIIREFSKGHGTNFKRTFSNSHTIFTEFPPGVCCYCVTLSNSIVYAIFIDCAVYFLASVAGLIGNTTFLGIPVHALKSSIITHASIALKEEQ